jgi:hypothetical protein
MKLLKSFSMFIAVCTIFIACDKNDDSGGTEPPPVNSELASQFYPGGVGSVFKFRIDTVNTGGGFDSVGIRNTNFANSQIIDNQEVFNQTNTVTLSDTVINSDLQFWRTDVGVYFVVDTSGINDLIDELLSSTAIDSTLLQNVVFSISSQLIAVSTPFGISWSAFALTAKDTITNISFNIMEVTGSPAGTESLFVLQLGENKTANKILYQLSITNPADIANPLIYPATGWFVKDIGLVKLQGNRLLVNVLSSGSVNFADTSTTARESLLEYQIM